MPVYTYKCPLCLDKKDISHPMAEYPKPKCENCNVELLKLMGLGSVSFKGGGWGSSPN